MVRFGIRRLFQMPVVLFCVILFLFTLMQLAPGDPAQAVIGENAQVSQEYIAEIRAYLGIDRPVQEQFWIYLQNVATGDLGNSYWYGRPVLDVILERVPATLLLMASATLFGTLVGTAAGVLAGSRPSSWIDNLLNGATLLGYSLPVFWLGQLAILVVAVQLGWLPTQGASSLRESYSGLAGVLDRARHLVLPALVLGTRDLATCFRLTRSGVIEAMSQDYILTARSKGLSRSVILSRHALRNTLSPLVTVTGLNIGFAFAGAALTEIIFGWPGIGRLTLDSISARDYPTILGIFIIVTLLVVVINYITDLVVAWIDPRIRLS